VAVKGQNRQYSRKCSAVFCKTDEEFGGLSNMAAGFPLVVNGVSIRTSEALYQACRFPHLPDVQRLIIEERSPMTAKMRSKPYRDQSRADWDSVRIRIMPWCLRVKLAQNWAAFGDLLRSTNDLPIVELSRKDDFWGAKPQEDGTLVGMNVLGRLLMELREDLRRDTGGNLKRVEPVPIPDFLLYEKPIGVVQDSRVTAEELTDPDLTPPDGALWKDSQFPSAESGPNEAAISAAPKELAQPVSPAAKELPAPPIAASPATCYNLCLPLLLQCLQREQPGEKQLAGIAKILDVLPKQLKTWIDRGIREGKIEKTKKKRRLVYVPAAPKREPTLFEHGEHPE
jgi:type I restriction enzyme S subunit